jgi:hypothetical protein
MLLRITLLILAIGISVLVGSAPASAQGVIDQEYGIKGGYLIHFGNLVEWPKGAAGGSEDFVIGVLGQNSFGAVLGTIASSKTIQSKKIVIRRFASAKEIEPCHMLFISRTGEAGSEETTAEERAKAAVEKTKGQPVLLISDMAGLAAKGTMISFFIEENLVKLEINNNAAKRAGLKISPRLLGLNVVRLVGAARQPPGPEYHAEYHARLP